MSPLEHYFENLLFNGCDVPDGSNQKALSKEEQFAAEVCAEYVLYSVFSTRDEFLSWVRRFDHAEKPTQSDTPAVVRCEKCSHSSPYDACGFTLYNCSLGEYNGFYHTGDHFCADGYPKQSDHKEEPNNV